MRTPTAFSYAQEFLRNFETYLAVYEKLETTKDVKIGNRLFAIGREIRQGTRSWTKSDLEVVVRWKHLERLMPRIERVRDIEERLELAFKIQEEHTRIGALWAIPGIGPVLASVMLTLTWPETCGVLDYHAWNALSSLGFDLPKKENDGSTFRIAEFLRYLRIIRKLARDSTANPNEVYKALYTLDKAETNENWKKQRWKMQLEAVKTSLRIPENICRCPEKSGGPG
jgi:hypothetical protein